MTDFLTRLAQRHLGRLPVIEPRVPASYAPAVGEAAGRLTIDEMEARPLLRVDGKPIMKAPPVSEQMTAGKPAVRPVPPTGAPLKGPESSNRTSPIEISPEEEPESGRMTERRPSGIDTPHPLTPRTRGTGPPDERLPAEEPASMPRGLSSADAQSVVSLRKAAPEPPARSADGMISESRRPSERPSAPPSLAAPRRAVTPLRRDTPDFSEPPVHVTIGRIEVTALTASPPPKRAPSPRRPTMSLED